MQRPYARTTRSHPSSKLRLGALGLALLIGTSLGAVAPVESIAATSHAQIFTAAGEAVTCGLAAHVPGSPREVLCAGPKVPAPKHVSAKVGDPGFVFLGKTGKPKLARLSQYSWQAEALGARPELTGGKWSSGSVGVTCTITKTSVKCTNKSGHGFTVTANSYKAF